MKINYSQVKKKILKLNVKSLMFEMASQGKKCENHVCLF